MLPRAWCLAAVISSIFALLQYFSLAAPLAPWISPSDAGQAYANLRQRNQFATLTNIGLAALLWWLAAGRGTRGLAAQTGGNALQSPGRAWGGVGAALAAALLVAGNAASASRTGLVQLALLIAMGWGWSRSAPAPLQKSVRRILLLAALAYGVATLGLPLLAGLDPRSTGLLARLQAGDPVCASRLTLWSNVLHLIAQKPWFGWGWGELDYAHFMTLYSGPRFCDILDNAHNLPLHLAVELGVPLALAACGLCAWRVWRAQPWRETHPTRQLAWAVLALIGLHSLLEYPLWYGPFQVAALLCVGWLWMSPMRLAGESPALGSEPIAAVDFQVVLNPLARMCIGMDAMVLLAFCAVSGWDYWRISQIYLPTAARAEAYREDTLQKIQGSWLFQDQVRFAELGTTVLTPDNAPHVHALALAMLHFSPEPQVVQKLIDSAVLLGREDEAAWYRLRFNAAFGPPAPAQAP